MKITDPGLDRGSHVTIHAPRDRGPLKVEPAIVVRWRPSLATQTGSFNDREPYPLHRLSARSASRAEDPIQKLPTP